MYSKKYGSFIKGRGDERRGKIVRCPVTCITLSWLIFIIVLLWQFWNVDCVGNHGNRNSTNWGPKHSTARILQMRLGWLLEIKCCKISYRVGENCFTMIPKPQSFLNAHREAALQQNLVGLWGDWWGSPWGAAKVSPFVGKQPLVLRKITVTLPPQASWDYWKEERTGHSPPTKASHVVSLKKVLNQVWGELRRIYLALILFLLF